MKSVSKKPAVVFVSNRFGYGPTVTMFHVIREIIKRSDAKLIFAGSGICKEAFDQTLKMRVDSLDIDERDQKILTTFLSDIRRSEKEVRVVSSLNRIAVKSADSLGIPSALIDCLAWMWKTVPEGYEKADMYFANMLGRSSIGDMTDVPLILGPIIESILPKNVLLINIGGASNHHISGISKNHLLLLGRLLNQLNIPDNLSVFVAGGRQSVDFLKKIVKRPQFTIESLSQVEYSHIQGRSAKIVTLAGMNSVFTSFAHHIPTEFLLPQMYSQWALTKILNKGGYTKAKHWDDYMSIPEGIDDMSEKEAMLVIEDLSALALKDDSIFKSILTDLQIGIDRETDISGENRCIGDFGIGGEKTIADALIKAWRL